MSTHVVASPYKTEHFLHNIWVIKFGKGSLFNMSVHDVRSIRTSSAHMKENCLLTYIPNFHPQTAPFWCTKSGPQAPPLFHGTFFSLSWSWHSLIWCMTLVLSWRHLAIGVVSLRAEKLWALRPTKKRSIDSTIETRHQKSMANLWKYWPSNLWRFLIQSLGTQMMRNEWIRLLWMYIDLPII